MSVKALSHVWEHSKQRGARLLVLLALADNANDDGFSWYAMAKLAKKARQDADATRDYIRAIETDGELIVYERKTDDGKMNHTNLYKVLFPGATEELPPDLRGQLRRRPALPPKPPRKRKKVGVESGGTGGFSGEGVVENHQSEPSVDPSLKRSLPKGNNSKQELDSAFDAIKLAWGIENGGVITQYRGMLFGMGTVRGAWKDCRITPAMTLDEFARFASWAKSKMSGMNGHAKMPDTPETIARWVEEFRKPDQADSNPFRGMKVY